MNSATEMKGDAIREFFKRWPRLYYFVMVVFGPGLLMNLSAKGFLRKYPREGTTLNIGSGPRTIAPGVLNVDITAYPGAIVASADALPFEGVSIARIVADTMLEHVPAPEAVIGEAGRVLKKGGCIYISFPFLYPFHSSPSDYTRWTMEGMRNLLHRHGFAVREAGVRAGPFSVIVLWLCYAFASLLCFGNGTLYALILNLSLLAFFPIKVLDILVARLPFAENFSSILYVVAEKE